MLSNQPKEYAGYEQGFPAATPRMQPLPPVSQLDAKDERLVEQSQLIGRLQGQNELLNEDNRRLEMENSQLKRDNAALENRNKTLESQATADRAGHRSAEDVIDEFVKELKNRTTTKEK